jgi:hypothetical protein
MPALSGIVEAISIKALNEPDRFGNLHRCSIKLGEDWVSWGTTKKPEISYKEGENYKTLQKGMEVEFMYKQNGDFKNISKTSLAVISTEGAQAVAPSAPAQPQAAPAYKPQAKGSFVNPAEVGQCMNLAAHIGGYSSHDMLDPEKACEAIQWYKRSRQLFTSLFEGVCVEETLPKAPPKPKSTAKKAVERPPMVMDLSDDDEI